MAQEAQTTDNSASKMHAVKDKMIGGIKETIGTVVGAEGMKESGREQKREGDAEALAAGKGKKHYDPALARKGVGIQHKHIGPNPKKLTEGPCAGCKDGTCQVGHDYDAAICHSVTQGHCDAGHVKDAGLGTDARMIHGDGVATSAPCCNDTACTGCTGTTTTTIHNTGNNIHDDSVVLTPGNVHHTSVADTTASTTTPVVISEPFNVIARRSEDSAIPVHGATGSNTIPSTISSTTTTAPIEPAMVHHQNIGGHHDASAIPVGHNTAYDAAACTTCAPPAQDGDATAHVHSERDQELMAKAEERKVAKEYKKRNKD